MGYYILHSKNTKLCVRKNKHHQEQALKEVREDACVKTRILTQESVAMALYGHKELEKQEHKPKNKYMNTKERALQVVSQISKQKQELSSQKVELSIMSDIESDVLTNGKVKDRERANVREAFNLLAKALEAYQNAAKRQDRIEKNSSKFKSEVDALGLSPSNLDQFAKNVYQGLYSDNTINANVDALSKAISALKQSSEI